MMGSKESGGVDVKAWISSLDLTDHMGWIYCLWVVLGGGGSVGSQGMAFC